MRGVRIPPEAALLFLSKGRSEPVSGGVVVLPCFVLNRSHRFNHVSVCGELLFIKQPTVFLAVSRTSKCPFPTTLYTCNLRYPISKTCPQTTRKSESSESSVPLDGHAYEN